MNKLQTLDYQGILDLNQVQLNARNKLNERIQNKKIIFEDVSCLCGSNEYDVISSIDRYGLEQQTVICKDCGLIRSNPRYIQEEYKLFYETDEYRLLYESNSIKECAMVNFDAAENLKDGQNIIQIISKFKQIDNSVNILEFGCGGGWNLIPFVRRGANCIGIDYGKEYTQLGREYGLNILQGSLESVKGKYDIIILSHVLEHFLDPISDLKEIKSHLCENGLLYISVPNITNLSLAQIQSAHTYYFCPDNLQYYVQSAGFKIIDYGKSQNIHMYGLFKRGDIAPDINLLSLSKKNMYRVIKQMKVITYIKLMLKKLNLFEILKTILKR